MAATIAPFQRTPESGANPLLLMQEGNKARADARPLRHKSQPRIWEERSMKTLLRILIAVGALAFGLAAHADTYPSKPLFSCMGRGRVPS